MVNTNEYDELYESLKAGLNWVIEIECKSCGEQPGKPCRDRNTRRRMRYPHVRRSTDRWQFELNRKKLVRETYLAEWFLLHGDIFKES
jgi:hypothetical protein